MSLQDLSSRAVIGYFYERLSALAPSWVGAVSMHVDSNQASEQYEWLGQVPQLREWVGGRLEQALRANGITVLNKTFEGTLYVSVDDIRRDKTGQVAIRVSELAERALSHKASLLSTLIKNGGATVCYDGQFFYDTDHTDPGAPNQTNQSNDIAFGIAAAGLTGTAAAPSARAMQAAILAGIAQLMGFLDDQGEPFNEMAREFTVMVPVNYMQYALAAVALPVLDSGATSLIANMPDFKIVPVVNPRLTSTTQIHVFRTDAQAKAFIEQEEEAITIGALAAGSEEEFKNNRHVYGVKRIGNVAYGLWQRAVRVTIGN